MQIEFENIGIWSGYKCTITVYNLIDKKLQTFRGTIVKSSYSAIHIIDVEDVSGFFRKSLKGEYIFSKSRVHDITVYTQYRDKYTDVIHTATVAKYG